MGQKVLRIESTLTFINVIFVSEHSYVFRIFAFLLSRRFLAQPSFSCSAVVFLLSRRFLAQPSFGLQPSFSAVVFSRQSGTPKVQYTRTKLV